MHALDRRYSYDPVQSLEGGGLAAVQRWAEGGGAPIQYFRTVATARELFGTVSIR